MLKAEAQGEAEAIAAKSIANAAAIQTIADALKGEHSGEAVRLQVANRWVNPYVFVCVFVCVCFY